MGAHDHHQWLAAAAALMFGFGVVCGPYLPIEWFQQLQGNDMSVTAEIKADVSKFESWIKTLELKFFKGKLHQKVVSPNPGETPDHAWLPIAAHDVDAPAAGEPIATAAAKETPPSGLHTPPPDVTVVTGTAT